MNKDEIIAQLRDMAKHPTVTLPRDCEALRAAADLLAQPEQEYKRGYADAMNWKVQNHLEHFPPQRTWVGLTDEDLAVCGDEDDVMLARYWERVCKEKNT